MRSQWNGVESSMTVVLTKMEIWTQTHTQEKKSCANWSYGSINQRTSQTAGQPAEARREAQNRFLRRASRVAWPYPHLILNF